jgi:hypothetical protein
MSANSFLTHFPFGVNTGETDVQTLLAGATTGIILTATITAAGTGYAANDTGTVNGGTTLATYKVLTVSTGAVATFSITSGGAGYSTGAGQATTDGGAQPGVGTGFTINVGSVADGDVLQTKLPDNSLTQLGSYIITAGFVDQISLALPGAGQSKQDGRIITVISTTAFAHVITTPANGINGANHIRTFGAAAGNSCELEAYNGSWYVLGLNGVTVS